MALTIELMHVIWDVGNRILQFFLVSLRQTKGNTILVSPFLRLKTYKIFLQLKKRTIHKNIEEIGLEMDTHKCATCLNIHKSNVFDERRTTKSRLQKVTEILFQIWSMENDTLK